MFEVTFTSDADQTAESERELSLLVLATRAGAALPHTCGGHARCGTCRVTITEGADKLTAMGSRERQLLEKKGAGPEDRLACQAWARGSVRCRY